MDKTFARSNTSTPLLATLAGALVLAVGMGFGRFAFTGMYPLMVREGAISVAGGSLAASANYAGYLLGAILVARFDNRHAARLAQFAMIGTIACLAALSLHFGTAYIIGVRFVAGALSAVALVAASIWLFHVIGYHQGAPVLYAGVGVGIVTSAEIIAFGGRVGLNGAGLWALLAAVALILCVVAEPTLSRQIASEPSEAPADAGAQRQSILGARSLVLIYGLAGFGYIVTATYLPLLVKEALANTNPVHVWAAFGLGAAPSCFLWHWLHEKLGSRAALAANLLVQAIGVILPAIDASAIAFLGSAILVGGTFVGTVTIAMPAARRVASTVRFNLIAVMTAAYGIGQIVGPLVANSLFAYTHSFNQPLAAAGVALVLAAIACTR